MTAKHSGRRGATFIEVVVVISIMAVLISLMLPAVQKARTAATRLQCANNLRQIGLGLTALHDGMDRFPDSTPGEAGWALLVLPYIEQSALADRFVRDVDASNPLNSEPALCRPPLFCCPARLDAPSFLAPIPAGHYGMNASLLNRKLATVPQTYRTLLLGEMPVEIAAPWVANPVLSSPLDATAYHNGGTNIFFADGHLEWSSIIRVRSIIFDINEPPPEESP